MDRNAYQALDPDERWTYDSMRLQWFGAGFWLKTADTMDLLRSVKGHLRTTHEFAVGERNIVLDGPANGAAAVRPRAGTKKGRNAVA